MARSSRIRKRFSPQLLSLEDRLTPTTFLVTSNSDSGPGTLREAVGFANVLGGADLIEFQAGLKAIVLTTGQLNISDAVTIQGPGAATLSVSGNKASRIFNTSPASVGTAVAISGLTLTGGSTATGNGGALLAGDESLTLTDCVLSGNTITGIGSGGAIGVVGGVLTLIRSTVTGNQSNTNGGGIDASAKAFLTLIDCTVAGNSTKSYGGGVNIGTSSLSLRGSTISNNIASDGGGLSIVGAVAASMSNSTVSGNSSTGVGGGLALNSHDGSVTVDNCTVANNTADGSGGGIARVVGNGTLTLKSTIVAGNTATGSVSEDLFSTASLTANRCAIGTSAGVTGFNGDVVTNALLGQNFKLGPLAYNGGLTKTHAPAADSPILNQGINSTPALSVDQRGAPFVRLFGENFDIGAFEVQSLFVVTTTADSGSGSLREAMAAANGNPGADTVSFDAGLFAAPQTITLTSGELVIGQAMTIAGPGAKFATINGNNASRIFMVVFAPQGAAISISGLTLTGGKGNDGGALRSGGQNITISDCRIAGNSATGYGGAIFHYGSGGSVTLDNCTFSANQALNYGGAILVAHSDLTMTNCTVSGNVAVFGPGGGVYIDNGTLSIRNSTFSGNTTASTGGAIALRDHFGVAQIRNSTITHNSAGTGGGICRNSGTGAIFVESSIVSGNTAATGPEVVTGGVVNATASIFGSTSGISKLNSDAATIELIGQAPLLGPLQDNGGTTFTHMPAFGSLAINRGLNPTPATTTDQRGPGYPRQRGPAIDIGAVETMTHVVTSLNDTGPGSLHQAMLDANAAAGADTIRFDPTAFATSKTISLMTMLPTITDGVSIIGPSPSKVTLTRAATASEFAIFAVEAPNAPVVFRGLTITGGYQLGGGGGMVIQGISDVLIAECAITGNATDPEGIGAGILSLQSSLSIVDSTISGNSGGWGSGIFFAGKDSLVVENSTIANNTAMYNGGGVYTTQGTLVLRNTTLSGNSAKNGGGLFASYSLVTIQNCTITANSAAGTGGGIVGDVSTMTLESTVVAGNTAGGAGDDLYGPITANFSLIGVANDGPILTAANNKTGSLSAPLNPMLGPLQANGGPTLTHLPLPGNPLRDAGSNPAALATDQRGLPRSVGVSDIGAVEDQTPPSAVTGLTVNGGAAQRSRLTKIHVIFSAPVAAAALTAPGAITLTRTAATGGGTPVDSASGLIVSPASGMVTSITLTFANAVHPGVQYASLTDGRWQLAIAPLNYLSPLNDANLQRLYGDIDNNGTVDASDLGGFGAAFGTSGVNPFDFNNDLTVDALDFGEFGNRFGTTL